MRLLQGVEKPSLQLYFICLLIYSIRGLRWNSMNLENYLDAFKVSIVGLDPISSITTA